MLLDLEWPRSHPGTPALPSAAVPGKLLMLLDLEWPHSHPGTLTLPSTAVPGNLFGGAFANVRMPR